MAKDTIEAIREAEIASQEKEKEARGKAAQMVEDARSAAKTLLADKLSGLKAEDEYRTEAVKSEGEKLLAQAEQEAQGEVQALRDRAGQNKAAAVDAVLKKLIA